MNERRKLKRKYMVFFGRVFDRKSAQLLGNVADMTTEGLMIISNQHIPVGQAYELRLDVPEHIFGVDHIDLEAQSIWSNPDIDPQLFNTGFQLKNLTPENAKIIELIVREYSIRG